jgi:L,D-transpeptidase catalytic domain/Putative peptidoglycan binding domain
VTYRRYRMRRRLKRVAVGLVLLPVALAVTGAATLAQDRTSREPGAQPPPAPAVAAAGVTVAGVPVEGLTAPEIRAAVEQAFARPLELYAGRHRWTVAPEALGAWPREHLAVRAALSAPEGTNVDLEVVHDRRDLRLWVRDAAERFDQPTRNSVVSLRRGRPSVSQAKAGLKLERWEAVRRIATALELHARGPVELPARRIEPKRTRAAIGPVIVIRRDSHTLTLYEGARFVARFGIAVGAPSYPTPIGRFEIVTLQRDPWWYPPDSDWAAGQEPVPPGPGNPLGTRWMGLSEPLIGIHGTPDAASIGYSASHGCIRMHIPDAEWLFERAEIGTPVFILAD